MKLFTWPGARQAYSDLEPADAIHDLGGLTPKQQKAV
jgi:hypothetical protein